MAAEDIIVEIADDALPPVEVTTGQAQRAELSDAPEAGIEDLKRQLAEKTAESDRHRNAEAQMRAVAQEEQRLRLEAERFAAQSATTASEATTEARERQLDSVVSATHAVNQKLSTLRAQYVKAQTDGEFEKAADINLEIGKASAELVNLEGGRQQLEARKKDPPPAAPATPARQETQFEFNSRPWNQAEIEIVLRNTPPAAAAWMRSHADYFTDVSFRKQVQAASDFVIAKGVTPNSEEYIRGVEKIVLGDQAVPPPTQVHKDEAVSSAGKQVTSRTSPTPAAPPSRSVPASPGSPTNAAGQRVVRLTPAQVEFARLNFAKTKADDPEPEVAYARNLEALRREGKLKGDGASL